MSKFNKNAETKSMSNMAGGKSFDRNDVRKDLIATVFSSMLNKDSYYESDSDRVTRIINETKASAKKYPEWTIKLMGYTRKEIGLRSVSHVMAVAIAETLTGYELIKYGYGEIFGKRSGRPDDITEILSLYKSRNDGKMSHGLKKGLKKALESFDKYQLKKYEQSKREFKLRDAAKILHVKDSDGRFKQLIEGKLPIINTVESTRSGGTKTDKAMMDLLRENKLGYMVMIKNLVNFLKCNPPKEDVEYLVKFIKNDNAILKSRLLPFRFLDAYNELNKMDIDRFTVREITNALEYAFRISSSNVTLFDETDRVALIYDESGSMYGQPFKVATTLVGSAFSKLNPENVITYRFSDNCHEVTMNDQTKMLEWISSQRTFGGGTYIEAPLKKLLNTNTKVNKIIIFTDMQLYGSWASWSSTIDKYINLYRSNVNPDVDVVFWNIEGYGNGIPTKSKTGIYEVNGYSDKMLDMIGEMIKDKNSLISLIDKYYEWPVVPFNKKMIREV